MDRGGTLGLFVDVGSTFTKLVVVDARGGELIATAQAPTTIDHDVMDGYQEARRDLPASVRQRLEWAELASSAAGGLRIASVGLTTSLSGRAGRMAALGAGGKVVIERAGHLADEDLRQIAASAPHVLLLSGGVDGGDSEVLVANAQALASLPSLTAVIVAGNRGAAAEVESILSTATREVVVADNVFPAPGIVQIDATRSAILDLFTRTITRAKGLDGLAAHLRTECEPTPFAVSRGAEVAAEVAGPVVVVDLGGATTDVHSVGRPETHHGAARLPELSVSRTVEGDIGMRWGAPGVVEAMGEVWAAGVDARLRCRVEDEAADRNRDPEMLATSDKQRAVDAALAAGAAGIALQRHTGRVVVRHNPWGDRYRIEGKDLRTVRWVLSTGGIFRHLVNRKAVLREALEDANSPMLPREPELVFDDNYALFAVGLATRRRKSLARELCVSAFADLNGASFGRPA